MARRSLKTLDHAASARSGARPAPANDMVTSSFLIPRQTYDILREAAMKKAIREGSRVSVSSVIIDLVANHRDELLR